MAFTQDEKSKILFYLGYSGFEDDGPAIRSINGLDAHETFMGTIVRDCLVQLAAIDQQIIETMPLAKAISTGGVQPRAHYTLDHLWRLGRQQVTRLSRWIKIWPGGDVFSTSVEASASFYSGDPSEKRLDPNSGMPTVTSGTGY